MASLTFDGALSEPDNDASHLLLHQLVVANDFSSLTPATAERYLNAFCDTSSSLVRRRWAGLAFAGMVGASADVVNYLQQLPQALQNLGAIVLSGAELEETKIVAGLVMRQALVQKIEYNSFWASDKVRNSAPDFPKDVDARWMAKFQDFLDALHSLALATSNNDTSIMYPVSLISPSELRWGKSNEGLPVAIVQAGNLTVLLPDRNLRDIDFIDIPINHIHSVRSKQSTLHDSQARTIEHEPWESALIFHEMPWSFRLNTFPRQETEVAFMFEHSADTKEWESCINEHHQILSASMGPPPLRIHPQMSSSYPIKCGSTRSATKQHTKTQGGRPHQGKTTSHSSGSSSQLHASPGFTIQNSTMHPQSKLPGPTQYKRALRRVEANVDTGVAGKRTEERPSLGQSFKASAGKENAVKYTQIHGPLSSVEQSGDQSPFSQITAAGPVFKPATASKGKLPRVSQSAKDKAFRRLSEHTDDFDMPTDEVADRNTGRHSGASTLRKGKAKSQDEPKGPSLAGHSHKSTTRNTRSRIKRKADDDDEFIPDEVLSKIPRNVARKCGAVAATVKNKRRKRMPQEPSESAMTMSDEAQVTTQEKLIDPILPRPAKTINTARKPRRAQLDASEDLHSFIKSSKASLIKGLVDSQKPAKPSSATFKKPLPPRQSVQQPSTPTKVSMKSGELPTTAQTPMNVCTRSTDRPLPIFRSSPPLSPTARGRNVWTPHIAAPMEILSSNSKPVPASPNAESTAISGHADREDVNMERKEADVQTAKSDPFRQRRVSEKVSSFTRRLTGEGAEVSPTKFNEVISSSSSERETIDIRATLQSRPEVIPWARKDNKEAVSHKAVLPSIVRTATPSKLRSQQSTSTIWSPKQPSNAGQSTKSKALGAVQQRATRVPQKLYSRLAEDMSKHIEQDLQSTTNELDIASPQQLLEDTQFRQVASGKQNTEQQLDEDETLINHNLSGDLAMGLIASPICFPSSPPIRGSPSCHSSTSAEDSDQPPTDPPVPNSDAEELEWEASLNPHQRALHDLLIRTSKRVLRHVVDNETAVTDIAEIFERDGEHVLHSVLERHGGAYDHVFHEMDVKRKGLQHELQDVAKHLAKQRRRIHAKV
ncbi:hypothetical protein T440DRAFT_464932 [Plenodomus tracheiphilus IPT5]|uniref:Uncharacterized protein n=1 Tax=Plenodomus tracheiphilus IPT5 TaxID=1408161 RepID=A0A6A7BHB6_9PLEO|nr:hypothetical protein T440DRAFT_464932 [Plenodomus tracheiphilus IPT5]